MKIVEHKVRYDQTVTSTMIGRWICKESVNESGVLQSRLCQIKHVDEKFIYVDLFDGKPVHPCKPTELALWE